MRTRRETLRRAAGLAAGALLAGLVRPVGARAQATEDEELRDFLEQAIELEQESVLAYDTAVEAPDVDRGLKPVLELLRDQEQAHANAWREAIDLLGFEAPDPPAELAEADDLGRLEELEKPEELLRFLAEHEQALISDYLELAPALVSEDLSRTAAEVAASHAQHLVVLGGELGDDPVEVLTRLAALR